MRPALQMTHRAFVSFLLIIEYSIPAPLLKVGTSVLIPTETAIPLGISIKECILRNISLAIIAFSRVSVSKPFLIYC
jgi:hypothetical protein